MHIHLIGAAGTAMATVAALLTRRGPVVTGSDAAVYPPMSDGLRAEGIACFAGSCRLGTDPDVVIAEDEYGSAFVDNTAKFLKYVPQRVIADSVEFDGADISPDLAANTTASSRLMALVPATGHTCIGLDDAGAAALVPTALMSNGGFDDIGARLLRALAAGEA